MAAHKFSGTVWTDGDDDEDEAMADVITRLNEALRAMKNDGLIESYNCGRTKE